MSRLGGLVIDIAPLRSSRAFRYAFAARLISLLGIGLLIVAVPAQMYQLTRSNLHVAGVSVVMAAAMFAGSLAGGVLADRFDRRRTIQFSRTVAGLGFLVLGLNAVLEHPAVWVIYAAAGIDGLAGGVSSTALMALTPALVGRDKMAAAGALVTLTTDLGTMITPALAGVIIAAGGVSWTYFVAAAATAITVTLFQEVGPSAPPEMVRETPLRALRTGLAFAMGERTIRGVLVVGLVVMLASGPTVLLPAFVDQVLHAGPATLGLLYGAPAVGAVLGTLTSGWTGTVRRSGLALLASMLALPIGSLVLGSTGNAATGAALMAFLGLAGFGLARAVNDIFRFAVLQHSTPDELRGRVSSLWLIQAVTGTALGSMTAGVLGQYFAPDTALLVYGLIVVVIGAVLFATLSAVRSATAPESVPV
ncbi:enterobactin transporter EntS [Nocardia sp. NPDC051832]|uniref:enterobactin transporter EntS n=1 Tax=Nocardia sp. NPDC051832 TaxID=3155673 RepID=UPI00343953F0